MAFVMKETTLKDRQKIYSEDVVKKIRDGGCYIDIPRELDAMQKKWFVDEDEDAYFCPLQIGVDRDRPSKWSYLIVINNNNIVIELKEYNTIIFLHNDNFLRENIVKVKNLIANGFAVAGRWGDGNIDGVNAVPDPIFVLNAGAKE